MTPSTTNSTSIASTDSWHGRSRREPYEHGSDDRFSLGFSSSEPSTRGYLTASLWGMLADQRHR